MISCSSNELKLSCSLQRSCEGCGTRKVAVFFSLSKRKTTCYNVVMKTPISRISNIIILLSLLWVARAIGYPIDFGELSLLVRAHESESSIVQQVSERKLLDKLTAQQEATLKSQGASDSLVQSLRNSNFVASRGEVAALERLREQRAKSKPASSERSGVQTTSAGEDVSIFEVAVDHPVNLSQWGGPDFEFTFSSRRFLGENVVTPAITHQGATGIETATYVGFGAATWEFSPSEYFAITSRSVSRPIHIDMQNPVRIAGLPYNLFPVYGAGGVSLYYISATTYSVRLAVSTRR